MGINFVEKYESLSDVELVKLSQSDNSDAGVALLRRYMGLVKSRASAFYNGSIEMDDLVQEGIISFYLAIRNYDFLSSSFSTFARICIDRGIISAIRSLARKKHIPRDKLVRLEEIKSPMIENSPEEILIESENASVLESNIKVLLSKLEYKVLLLYLHNYSYSEIAEELCISQKAVNNAAYRIKNKLKSL